jgi:hypothetical protein
VTDPLPYTTAELAEVAREYRNALWVPGEVAGRLLATAKLAAEDREEMSRLRDVVRDLRGDRT